MLAQTIPSQGQLIPVAGDDYYREIAQTALDYFNQENEAGRLKPEHLALYTEVIPKEPKFTATTKAALLDAVYLAAQYHFGMTPQRLKQSLAGYSPGMGDLAELQGFLKSVVKFVGGVVKGAVKVGKSILGIPADAPVAIQIETPVGTPQPVQIAPGVTAQIVPQIGAGAVLGPVGDFLKSPFGIGAILLAVFLMLPKGRAGRRRR